MVIMTLRGLDSLCAKRYSLRMKLTNAQAGKLGGRKRWASMSKKRRKEMMRELALKRWKKV